MAVTDTRGREIVPIGPVIRVQVQRDSLKRSEGRRVWYDPAPLLTTAALHLTPTGAVGRDDAGDAVMDVHNAQHPASRYRGENGISVGFTAHYAKMRDRFGSHLADGIAAESLLVETDHLLALDDVAAGFVIITRGGKQIALGGVEVAEPCAPFSRFCLGLAPDAPTDNHVTDALRFLRGGTRGFYATLDGDSATVTPGDTLCRLVARQ